MVKWHSHACNKAISIKETKKERNSATHKLARRDRVIKK